MTVIQLYPTHLQREEPTPFQVGVNYWPAGKGPSLFARFDVDEVHADMNAIAEHGVDFVRVFLSWADFQPDPEGVNCCALGRLAKLCDAAAAEGVKVVATLFTGYMMNNNWVPQWLLDSSTAQRSRVPVVCGGSRVQSAYRDPLTDPQARKAALRLVRAVARTLSDHQAMWAYDLGNVPDLFSNPAQSSISKDWYVEMATAIRNLDEHHGITCALGAHCVCSGEGMRADDLSSVTTFSSVGEITPHYSLGADPLDPALLAFNCALGAELSGKPCLSLGWNIATLPVDTRAPNSGAQRGATGAYLVDERSAAEYTRQALQHLLQVGARGAIVGSYSDFEPELFASAPFDTDVAERYKGLWRADGTLKPHGSVVKEFAESNPLAQPPSQRRLLLDVSADAFYSDPHAHCTRLFRGFSAETMRSTTVRQSTPVY